MQGSLEWTPDKSLPLANNYGIKISQGSLIAYTLQFGITDKSSVLANSSMPSSSTDRTSSPATSSPSSTSSPNAETITAFSNEGLNTGQIAGIGIGAALGGLVLAIVAFFVRRTLRRKSKPATIDTEIWAMSGKPELDSKSLHRIAAACEMDAKLEVRELHANGVVGEMEAKKASYEPPPPQELHAESRQVGIDSKSVA